MDEVSVSEPGVADDVFDAFAEGETYQFADKKIVWVVACLFIFAFVFVPALLVVML